MPPVWKAHSLANEHEGPELDLSPGAKVVTTVDLQDVPEGTKGKVLLANGFNWKRYRVLFENGAEVGHLDGRHIRSAKK